MVYDFKGRVALVTGAGSGLGLATAESFAKEGAVVVLADHDAVAVRAAAEALTAAGHIALGLECDVANEEQVAALVGETVARFGRLDFAYNNAGVHIPVAETADVEGDHFERLNAVNYRGVWNAMKHELRHMRTQGSGAIVNCSSQSGLVGTPGLAAYTASKHAVIGLTRSAALEYAPRGIRVNAICPGCCLTPMIERALVDEPQAIQAVIRETPLGRLGQADEIAKAVMWLCSPGAAFVVGHALVVDGGYTIR